MIAWEYCRLEMKLNEGRGEQIVLYNYQPILQSTQVIPRIVPVRPEGTMSSSTFDSFRSSFSVAALLLYANVLFPEVALFT